LARGGSSFLPRNKMHTLSCSKPCHLQKSTCGTCGYPARRKRKYHQSMDFVKEQHLNPRGQQLWHPVHLKDFNTVTQDMFCSLLLCFSSSSSSFFFFFCLFAFSRAASCSIWRFPG
uniref:60S ribosomal protein L37 n=1 Tax=Sus scrofa TaxID=9823 RepID=A0A4X1VII8_PIG